MPNELTTLNSLSVRSEEVQEIIGRPPHWIIRWGITIFFLVLVMVLVLSWLIKYPDIVGASFTLTSVNAPKSVVAHANGQLINLFAEDHEQVKQGQILGFIESTANPHQVLKLEDIADSVALLLDKNQTSRIPDLLQRHYTHLGELQTAFQTFNQAFMQFKAYLSSGYYLSKKKILTQDLQNFKALKENLLRQQEIAQRDYVLAQQNYQAQKKLIAQKVIAPLTFKQEESKLLSKKLPLSQLKSSIISNESSQNGIQDQLLELEKNISQQKITFLQAVNTLKSAIAAWKYQYVLTAPVNGTVSFITFLQENQTVMSEQNLFYIVPDNTAYLGQMYVSQFNFGKIHEGEKVLVKFSGYPFQEYGSVQGKIAAVSNVPRDSSYLVKVSLPKGLTTNYGKELTYRNGMSGSGEIITANKRLIEKFIYNMRKALNKR